MQAKHKKHRGVGWSCYVYIDYIIKQNTGHRTQDTGRSSSNSNSNQAKSQENPAGVGGARPPCIAHGAGAGATARPENLQRREQREMAYELTLFLRTQCISAQCP
jgi:hypothetical protein